MFLTPPTYSPSNKKAVPRRNLSLSIHFEHCSTYNCCCTTKYLNVPEGSCSASTQRFFTTDGIIRIVNFILSSMDWAIFQLVPPANIPNEATSQLTLNITFLEKSFTTRRIRRRRLKTKFCQGTPNK